MNLTAIGTGYIGLGVIFANLFLKVMAFLQKYLKYRSKKFIVLKNFGS